jgi:hypothetical protein
LGGQPNGSDPHNMVDGAGGSGGDLHLLSGYLPASFANNPPMTLRHPMTFQKLFVIFTSGGASGSPIPCQVICQHLLPITLQCPCVRQPIAFQNYLSYLPAKEVPCHLLSGYGFYRFRGHSQSRDHDGRISEYYRFYRATQTYPLSHRHRVRLIEPAPRFWRY